jgi:hypothetical protein
MSSQLAQEMAATAPLPVARRTVLRRAPALLRVAHAVLAAHRPYLVAVSAFFVGSEIIARIIGWRGATIEFWYSLALLRVGFVVAICWVGWQLLRLREDAARRDPTLGALEAYRAGWRVGRAAIVTRLTALVVVTAMLALACASLASWRTSILALHPFAYDAPLAALDRAVHGGRDPWRLFTPLLASPLAVRGVGELYSVGWGTALLGVLATAVLTGRRRWSQQVLVTFVAQWAIVGSLLAIVASSAGPVYYARVVPDGAFDPTGRSFAELLRFLNVAFQGQGQAAIREWLWAEVSSGPDHALGSISAFPSLHVSTAVLVALAASSQSRLAGIVGWTFALLILAGSVMLGWHYAVDGYASVLVVSALWWLIGRGLDERPRRDGAGQRSQ